MPFELEIGRLISSVSIKDMYVLIIHSSKILSPIAELNFLARFERDFFIRFNLIIINNNVH